LSAITAIHNISDYKYLYYNLLHQKEYIQSLGVGSTFKAISAKEIQSLPIFLPSIEAQRHIAATLDKANELITLRKKQLQELDALAEAVFYDMFDDPVKNEKGWERKKWNDLFDTRLGKMLDKNKQIATDERLPYLGNTNVLWGEFSLNSLQTMTFSSKEKEILKLRPDDLLICEGGEAGRCAVWQQEDADIYFQKAIHRERMKNDAINVVYVQKLLYEMKRKGGLKKYLSKATIEHLTGEKLDTVIIPLPPSRSSNPLCRYHRKNKRAKSTGSQSIARERRFVSTINAGFVQTRLKYILLWKAISVF
jgi:type I restriction enzyme S subunit